MRPLGVHVRAGSDPGDFGLASFSPIVISSVVATVVSRHFLGNLPAILVPPTSRQRMGTPSLRVVGILSALVATLFTVSLYRTEEIFQKGDFPDFSKRAWGLAHRHDRASLPARPGFRLPAIDLALRQLSWITMLLLVGFKILATSITLGSGGSGERSPLRFFWVPWQGRVWECCPLALPHVTASPGAYSIVGMAGVLSGTIHGPLSAILILFEMTDNYRIILP